MVDVWVGGGTWFEALLGPNNDIGAVVDAEMGHAIAFAGDPKTLSRARVILFIAFSGPLRHAGHPITSGTRLILVLFLYVEGFSYGHLLDQVHDNHIACEGANKQSKSGEFVVYNETYELMTTLDGPSR